MVKILDWFESAKRPLAWITTVLVLIAGVLQNVVSGLLPVAAFLYLVTITSILLELHGRTQPQRTVYPSHQEAGRAFYHAIRRGVEREGDCELTWIGVTMQSAWLTLENALGRDLADGKLPGVHIRLLQSDPRFLKLLLDGDSNMSQLTSEQWEQITTFGRRNLEALTRSGSSLGIAQYSHMPNYHGLLINRKELFLSTVRWEGPQRRELSVPHEPFERFDESTERGRYMIKLYVAWLEKGFDKATRVARFPEVASESEDEGAVVEPRGVRRARGPRALLNRGPDT